MEDFRICQKTSVTQHLSCHPALSALTTLLQNITKTTAQQSYSCLFPAVPLRVNRRGSLLEPTDLPLFPESVQCRRLSTSLSVSERRPLNQRCVYCREKSLLINLLQTGWRKWPGGCKLRVGERRMDEGQNGERGTDGQRAGEKLKRRNQDTRKRRKQGRKKRARKEGVFMTACVCVAWCKPWVLVDGWI